MRTSTDHLSKSDAQNTAEARARIKEMLETATQADSMIGDELREAAATTTDENDKPFRRFRDDLERKMKVLEGTLSNGKYESALKHLQGTAVRENFKSALEARREGGFAFGGVPAGTYLRLCIEEQIARFGIQLEELNTSHEKWLRLYGITPRAETTRTRVVAAIGRFIKG